MNTLRRVILLSSLAVSGFVLTSTPYAQEAGKSDLSGHWQESPQDPGSAMGVSLDIYRDASGNYQGTYGQLTEGLKGLLLNYVELEGKHVEIVVRDDQPFIGELSVDGQRIDGAFQMMGFEVPLILVRTGAAEINQGAPIAAVTAQFTGQWTATLGPSQINLKINNHTDGTASAELINITDGNLRIPAASLVTDGNTLTIELPAVNGAFAGSLSDDGNLLDGSYSQGANSYPMSFVRLN